jgi:hypothetical protein
MGLFTVLTWLALQNGELCRHRRSPAQSRRDAARTNQRQRACAGIASKLRRIERGTPQSRINFFKSCIPDRFEHVTVLRGAHPSELQANEKPFISSRDSQSLAPPSHKRRLHLRLLDLIRPFFERIFGSRSGAKPSASGAARHHTAGEQPDGKRLDSQKVAALADRVYADQHLYFVGKFLVTAIGENKAVLRYADVRCKSGSSSRSSGWISNLIQPNTDGRRIAPPAIDSGTECWR